MIQLLLDLDDLTDGSQRSVMLPCNLKSQIPTDHDYAIISTFPELGIWLQDDVWKLNATLDEINCENPEMTADYLGALIDASGVISLYNEEFLQRVKENDFVFADITNADYDLGLYGNAACYLLSEHGIPFFGTRNVIQCHALIMAAFKSEEARKFVDWSTIWDTYSDMGFKIVDWETDLTSKIFLINW